MDYRQILSNHFRSNGHPVLADQIVSGRFPMVDEIAAMKTVREITIEECAQMAWNNEPDAVISDMILALRLQP